MTRRLRKTLLVVAVFIALYLGLSPVQPQSVLAEPDIYVSPVHAGCYLARNDICKIHVEPFTINLASGKKLVRFQLIATRISNHKQTVIYDFRPDTSNPLPVSGNSVTPSLVAKDFAAECSQTYSITLQGQDTGDTGLLNLGVTNQFTCPVGTYNVFLPVIKN